MRPLNHLQSLQMVYLDLRRHQQGSLVPDRRRKVSIGTYQEMFKQTTQEEGRFTTIGFTLLGIFWHKFQRFGPVKMPFEAREQSETISSRVSLPRIINIIVDSIKFDHLPTISAIHLSLYILDSTKLYATWGSPPGLGLPRKQSTHYAVFSI